MEPEEESKTIMLRGLPLNVIEDDIRSALEQLEGPQPVEIRLMRKRREQADDPGEKHCAALQQQETER